MQNDKPVVSVLMPAYNAEKYIVTAIDSILNQTFRNFEFLIIDDGSTDRTWEIIQTYVNKDSRIVPIKNEKNLKLVKTLNRGILIAKTNFIARMDSDDYSLPERIQKQHEYLINNPGVGVVGTWMYVCDTNLQIQRIRQYASDDKDIRRNVFRYNPFSHPTTMFRKEVLLKCGGYNEEYKYAEDYELYFRIGMVSKFHNLAEPLLKYRITNTSFTSSGLINMEKYTFKARFEHRKEYRFTIIDVVYNILQLITLNLVPTMLRIRLFSLLRDRKIND